MAQAIAAPVDAVLVSLKRLASKRTLDEMGPRYGIHTGKAFGVSMANMKGIAKEIGKNHELAAALWATGWYEARMLCALIDDPARVTPAQMERWCRDFDNWAICDTVCFHLFDKVPDKSLAFRKVAQWGVKKDEFVKRGAFALLASLALHDKVTGDGPFLACLPLVERAATDERNFVKKGVSWALRGIGARSPALHAASLDLALRLADSPREAGAARWVGKDVLRDITRPMVAKRLAGRAARSM